jgi:hypothetical protein
MSTVFILQGCTTAWEMQAAFSQAMRAKPAETASAPLLLSTENAT